jgi:two-component system, cell cycle response regulator CtrA
VAASFGELKGLLEQSKRRLNDAWDALRDAQARLDMAQLSASEIEAGEREMLLAASLPEDERETLVRGVLAAIEPLARLANEKLLALDADCESFRIGRRTVPLSTSERQILRVLWEAQDSPVSREDIADVLYGDAKPSSRTIDVLVTNLRRKLRAAGDGFAPIETVRGHGWRLMPRHRAKRENT